MQLTRRHETARINFFTPCPALLRYLCLMLLGGLAHPGCRLFDSPEGTDSHDLVRPPNASPDSVTIEVLLALVPDPRLARLDEVWLHADEQVLDARVRRELARNGFRAGVVGPAPPPGLAELLQLEANGSLPGDAWQSVPLDKRPTITGHRLSLRPQKRAEVQLEPVYERAPLLVATDVGLAGRDYTLAQGRYALEWSRRTQGRIQVELTPELDHGQPRTQYTAGEGNDIHRQLAKEREVFEQLRIEVPLSAGQMLLISGDGKGGGSLGHFFHSVPSPGGDQQRLVVVRLAQVPSTP
jgi:hypothetical protein